MSFEGSYIFLCANGHRSDRDAYDDVEYFCDVCRDPIVWQYIVDSTNCSGVAPVFQQLDYDEDEDDEWRMLRYAIPSNAELGTVDLSKLNVPMAHVWFLDNDSGNVFPTEEAAWRFKSAEFDNGGQAGPKWTLDLNNGQRQKVTITGDVDYLTIKDRLEFPAGNFSLRIIQDATGGRTIGWPSSVRWPGGVRPVTSKANATDIITLYSDGNGNYYATALSDFE